MLLSYCHWHVFPSCSSSLSQEVHQGWRNRGEGEEEEKRRETEEGDGGERTEGEGERESQVIWWLGGEADQEKGEREEETTEYHAYLTHSLQAIRKDHSIQEVIGDVSYYVDSCAAHWIAILCWILNGLERTVFHDLLSLVFEECMNMSYTTHGTKMDQKKDVAVMASVHFDQIP